MNSQTLFELIGTADDELLEHSEWSAQEKRSGIRAKRVLVIAAAIVAALAVAVTAAASMGYDPVSLIRNAFAKRGISEEPTWIQAHIDAGEWIYLNDDYIAVIVPESPVKILFSYDGGGTWRESVIEGSEGMSAFDDWHDNIVYYGGYIGFFGEDSGYLVLEAPPAMGMAPIRIYLTGDGGETWREIGDPNDVHLSIPTGAGFATPEIGFISYRYREDAGPDIWRTLDGGDTWEKLAVTLPDEYTEEYRFTPLTPTFNGENGVYPIETLDPRTDEHDMIYMLSGDHGLTWNFE